MLVSGPFICEMMRVGPTVKWSQLTTLFVPGNELSRLGHWRLTRNCCRILRVQPAPELNRPQQRKPAVNPLSHVILEKKRSVNTFERFDWHGPTLAFLRLLPPLFLDRQNLSK